MTTSRGILFIFIFTMIFAGCSNAGTVDDDGGAESPTVAEQGADGDDTAQDEPSAERADRDLTALIDQQLDTCNDLICERPFLCLEESGQLEIDAQPAIEECQREYCEVQREILHEVEHTEQFEACLEADERATNCLQETSCDDLMAFISPDMSADHVCPDEVAVRQQACAFLQQQAQAPLGTAGQ